MLARERQDAILKYLRLHGAVRVSDLVPMLGVSEITVRRDLTDLAESGLLLRTHGGALAAERRLARNPDAR